jgi:hypothetical protein
MLKIKTYLQNEIASTKNRRSESVDEVSFHINNNCTHM